MIPNYKQLLENIFIGIASFLVALLLVEGSLRLFNPFTAFDVDSDLFWFREEKSKKNIFIPDETLGFRPVVGNGIYDNNGILLSGSIIPSAGGDYKILFIGDSVTARGRIQRAIANTLPSRQSIAYLNGGVESYNIQQEVEFFFRYQTQSNPNHIIHILHVNDLQATPIAFLTSDGALNVYSFNMNKRKLNGWLLRNSQLYRLMIAVLFARPNTEVLIQDARSSLLQIQTYARLRDIKYDAVLFPILAPTEKWSSYEKESHALLMDLSQELTLNVVDLLPVLEGMISEGLNPQESAGDVWHPNDLFAKKVAGHVIKMLTHLQRLK